MVKKVTLIGINSSSIDPIGQPITSYTRYDCLADEGPITQTEFFSAGQNGITPDGKYTVWASEYHGERLIEVGNERYTIYRTYPVNGKVELYAGWRVGTYTS